MQISFLLYVNTRTHGEIMYKYTSQHDYHANSNIRKDSDNTITVFPPLQEIISSTDENTQTNYNTCQHLQLRVRAGNTLKPPYMVNLYTCTTLMSVQIHCASVTAQF